MRKILAAFLLLASLTCAEAASRFWNPYSVTGAISGTGGVCRLTITPAIVGSGLVAGTSVIVTGITGVTGCNVTTTISTVVDTTHIELTGTTFGGAGFGGTACAAGGVLTSTNTANWAASSTATCGSGGSSVPGSADSATLDANSKGGTVVLNFGGLWTLTSLDVGAFTGTFENSINNNNITATGSSGISFSGTGTRTINMGSATYTASNSTGGPQFSMGTTTNLTLNAGTSTIAMTGTDKQTFNIGTQTVNIVSLSSRTAGSINNGSATGNTIKTLNIAAPNAYITNASSLTNNITTALNVTGTSATNQVLIRSGTDETAITISSAAAITCSYCAFRDITFSGGGSLRASSSLDLGNNTGITFGSGTACILGGWLLWRDMPEHLNDNFPAWLEKAA